jgi:hypothetical protein
VDDNLGEGICPRLYLVEEKTKNVYYFEISEKELNIKTELLEILKDNSTAMEYIERPKTEDSQVLYLS